MDGDRDVDDQAGPASSVTATPTKAATTPNQMSNVQHVVTNVENGAGGRVKFTWDDPKHDQIDKYQYRYDATASNPDEWDKDWTNIPDQLVGDNNKDLTVYDINIPGSSTNVFYELRAVNNDADDTDTADVNEGAGPPTAITVSRANTPGTSTEPPSAPGSLTSTPGLQSVTLNWTAPATPTGTTITKYQYRQSSSQDSDGNAIWTDWVAITTTTSGTTISGTVSELEDGKTYTFEVRAFHDNKTPDDSNPANGDETEDDQAGAAAQAEGVTPGAPNAPTALSGEADGDEQITLTWTAVVAIEGVTVTGFEYRKRASGDATWGEWTTIPDSGDGEANRSSYSVTGLDFGTDYEFQVRAVSASGNSQPSPTASATTITPPVPDKPTGLTATPGDDSVTLSWVNPANLTIGMYRYRQSESTDFALAPWTIIVGSGPATTSHEITGLTVGTLYYFQIQAGSPQGDSAESDTVSARPVPVRGEWTFTATIDPNPLTSGSEDGAAVSFTAVYTVTSGTPTDLSFAITGSSPNINVNFAAQDNAKVGIGDSLSDFGSLPAKSKSATIVLSGEPACTSSINVAGGTIRCEFNAVATLFAAVNASPGQYSGTLTLSDGMTFTARSSTGDYSDFVSASASKDDIGNLALDLQVTSGLPAAPAGFSAAGGNSLATLSWDDPDNAGITGYEYRYSTLDKARLTWEADSQATDWQYRQSTLAQATLTWNDPGDTSITKWQYRRSTDNWITYGEWADVDSSGATTVTVTFKGLDPDKANSFEVRPVRTDTPGDAVTLTGVEITADFTPPDWVDIVPSDSSTTEHIVTGLVKGETYYFEVRAVRGEEPQNPVAINRETIVGEPFGGWTSIGLGDTTTDTTTDPHTISYVVGGLDNNEWYDFQLRAVTPSPDEGLGPEATSGATSLVAGQPAEPTGFTAVPSRRVSEVKLSWAEDTTATGGWEYRLTRFVKADLTWTDSSDSEITGWQYRYSADGGDNYGAWTDVDESSATTTTATVSGLEPGADHSFEVRPVKPGGDQPPVTLTGDPTITSDFTDSGWTFVSGSATTTEHKVTGLDFSNKYHADLGNTYGFEVRKVTATNDAIPVTTLTLTYLGSVTLSWDDPKDSTINDYQYRQSTDGGTSYGEWQDIDSSDASPVTHTVGELTALSVAADGTETDTVYTFQLRAVNNAGDGDATDTDTDTAHRANPGLPLAPPMDVKVRYDPASTGFTVRWDAHAVTTADFEVRGTGPGGAVLSGTAEADTTTDPVTPATSMLIQSDLFGEFNFEVVARNNFGPWSDPVAMIRIANPFGEAPITREIDEDAPAGSDVGKPVVVDVTGFSVSYSLGGSDFSIDSATGRISLTGETPRQGAYPVTVTASMSKDGALSQASVVVTINVTAMDPWVELATHRPADGAAGYEFGNSVAVDGETRVSVIGAPQVGNAAGAAYVYERPGDYSPAKLTAPTPADNENFGNSVAVNGDTVVVGTSGTDKVYVFTKTGSGWSDSSEPAATLTGTAGEGFGGSVAISENTIFVGAKDAGTNDYGAVYVFVKPTDGWANADTTSVPTLTASDGATDAELGSRVAVEGDGLVVVDSGAQAVYYFAKPTDGWATGTETAKLTATGDEEGDWFGALSADIDGGTIVVGATQIESGVDPRSGAVYVFTGSGNDWTRKAILTALGGDPGDGFGKDVQISGDVIAAGRRNQADNDRASSVQVFKKPSGGWDSSIVPSVLLASDGEADDLFGHAVALDGKLMVVGALGEDTRGDNAGAAYVFSSVTRPNVSRGVLEVVHPYSEPTVTGPNGITQVTIPGGAVPTGTGSFWRFVRFSGCTGVPGGTVHDCISVQLYDLDANPVRFNQDTLLDDEAEVTLSRPSGVFTVRKGDSWTNSWRTVPPCSTVATGECYTVEGNTIVVSGITSFSQFAVTKASRPGAPTELRVSLGNRQVDLTWTAPSTTGGSAIRGYDYSLDGGTNWTGIPGSDRSTSSYTVTNLRNGITYQFAVRARNSAGSGPRSNIAEATPRSRGRDVPPRRSSGGSATSHVPPTFDEGASTTRQIAENSPTGTRIGGPLVARDPLERRVLYTKGGPDADLFDVASQTGQIFVRRGATLDYESGRRTYLIEVVGNTGVGGPGKIAVTIIVTNVPETGSITLSPDTPPEVGTEITGRLSDPDGGVTGASWQWQRSANGTTWTDIEGATSASYRPSEADRGMMLRVSVRYNDEAATGINLVSIAIGPVQMATPPLPLDLPGSVTLSPVGAPEVGTEITATLTDPDGGVAGETWQWQRSADGVTWTAIDGASTASYTPVESDVGMMLRANVSYSDAVAAGVSLVGATTEAVAAMPAPDRPGSVALSPEGTPEIGKAITATVTDPDGEVTGEVWQWQRSADRVTWTDIDGATTEKYTPTEADAGRVLRANVSYNDAVATGVNAMGMNTEAVAAGPAPDLETPTPTPTPPSPPVRPATPTLTPTPTLVVPPQTSTPTQTMLPTPPPTDVPPTPTAITSEVTPTEAPTTPVTPEEEGGFPAWLIIVIIIGAVIIIAGIIIIVRSRIQQ